MPEGADECARVLHVPAHDARTCGKYVCARPRFAEFREALGRPKFLEAVDGGFERERGPEQGPRKGVCPLDVEGHRQKLLESLLWRELLDPDVDLDCGVDELSRDERTRAGTCSKS